MTADARLARVFDNFERLVSEAEAAPIDTWDFGWLAGRATEDRPSWRYFDRVVECVESAERLLDVQAGVGHLIADLPHMPRLAVAADGYEPSIRAAAPRVHARGAHVVWTEIDRPALPFASESFDLVVSRHPVDIWWREIARVLHPGGRYLAQHVGPHSLRELSEALVGVQPSGSKRDPELERQHAEEAGLVVDVLQTERPRVVFYDIGAVVYFLRLVVWTVPDFSVARYRSKLEQLHHHIEITGCFETSSSRVLIEAIRPS